MRQVLWTVVTAGALLVLPGCLVVSGKHIDETGVKLSGSTLMQVEPGVTTGDWLMASLGEPTEKSVVDESGRTEIWKYTYTRTRSSGGAVFLIFAGGSEERTSSVTYFELVDGYVTRYWSEE